MYKKELIHKIGHMTEWRCFPCEVEATLDAFCEAVKEVLQDGGESSHSRLWDFQDV